MKSLLISTVLIATMLISFNANSQSVLFQSENNIVSVQDNQLNPCIKKIEAIEADGKVYLKWIVNGEKENCFFYIQRSTDGKNFETIALKQAVGNSAKLDLLYCYTDQKTPDKTTYYRIARCYDCGLKLYSELAMVTPPTKEQEIIPVFASE